jgi:hypothetical protein
VEVRVLGAGTIGSPTTISIGGTGGTQVSLYGGAGGRR